jgi:2-amino-4-hydroxy-6-hydroxymethyldihydropteridine diphosphokinase
MILLGVGANLAGPDQPTPLATCRAALKRLSAYQVTLRAVSPWYESEPVPKSDQPWYVNAVARVDSCLDPAALLENLHSIELQFGRVRGAINAARSLDLDLLDHDGVVIAGPSVPTLPHPRMHSRAFVLMPLRDLCPGWRHPVSGSGLAELISRLPDDQVIRRVES